MIGSTCEVDVKGWYMIILCLSYVTDGGGRATDMFGTWMSYASDTLVGSDTSPVETAESVFSRWPWDRIYIYELGRVA